MGPRRRAMIVGVALVLSAIAYANSLFNGFHFDDGHSIEQNVWLHDLRFVPRYFWDLATFSPLAENRAYRPILLFGFAVSHALGGGAPWAYRTVSIALHAGAAATVGVMTWRMWPAAFGAVSAGPRHTAPASFDDRLVAAVLATAVMASHPLATEAVNYVSARSSLQAAALMFLSLSVFIDGYTRKRAPVLFASAVVLLLAMGTKIIAVTAPALALAWLVLLGPDRHRWSVAKPTSLLSPARALLPLAFVAFVFTVLHEVIVGREARAARSIIPPLHFFWTQTRVWLRYQAQFFWPHDLCADLTMAWSQSPWSLTVAGALLAAATASGLAVAAARRRPLFAFGVLWFYIALSPTNSFVPLSEPASEHRVYIALPGLIWAVLGLWGPHTAVALRSNPTRRWLFAGLSVALIAALTAGSLRRNPVWRDGESLWGSVLQCAPDNGRAHLNYGRARMIKGDYATAKAAFDRCQALLPSWIFCRINAAALALAQGRPTEAERHMAAARSLKPDNIYTLTWSGQVHLVRNRAAAAERAFRRALKVAPGFTDAERGLAVALVALEQDAEAAPILARLANQNRLDAEGWYAYGQIAARRGHRDLARTRFSRAIALGLNPKRLPKPSFQGGRETTD